MMLILKMPRQYQPQPQASKLPIVAAAARVVILVSLVVSLAITKSNETTLKPGDVSYRYSSEYSSINKYGFVIIVVGSAYSALQTPFTVSYAITGKRFINLMDHYGLLRFDFYGDAVISYVLGTAAREAFVFASYFKCNIASGSRSSEYDDFCKMVYASAGFLLIGFVSSGVLFVISYRELTREG